jgi:hypothetical protein
VAKQCFEQAHMTCAEFGLWVQYQKLAYKTGRLYCDGRRTAERFSGESKDHIYRLRRSLAKKGWLEVIKGSERDKNTQRVTVTEFRVLDHAAWTRKHGRKHCKSELFPNGEPFAPVQMEPVAPVQMEPKEPVAPVQTPCRTSANEPVAPARHSIKETQLQENQLESIASSSERTSVNKQNGLHLGSGQGSSLAEPNMPPVAPVQMDPPESESEKPPMDSNDPFIGVPTSQLVSEMLPHATAMKLYHKYNKGTEYNQHRAEIIAMVLEHRQTAEVTI